MNEAISEAKKDQAIAPKKQGSLQWSLRTKKAGIGLAFSKSLIEVSTAKAIEKEHEKIQLIFSQMLDLINQGDFQQLFSLYLEAREGLIRFSTLKGWWICQVLIRLHKERKIDQLVPYERQIHLPKEPKESSANHFFSYFLGLNRFWLDLGNMLLALPTLNCLRQLLNRTEGVEGIVRREARKEMIYQMELDYDRLYLAQHKMRPSELDNFAIDRMIIYLQAGFLDKALGLLLLIVEEEKAPLRWNELLGEAYLGSKVLGKGYSQCAYDVFSKALDLLPTHDRKGRDYFERRLLHASMCIILEQEDTSKGQMTIVLERFNTRYPHFQRILDQLSINEIIVTLKVIIKHEIVLLYANFLHYLKTIQIERLKTPLTEKIDLCVLQLQLHVLQKDFKGAAGRWLDLYYLEKKMKRETPGELCVASEWLYKLVEQDEEMAQKLVELDPKNPYSKLALAYHSYLEDDLDQALEIIKEIARLVERDDLEWLAKVSQTNFVAFIAYSYIYSDEDSLENYFEAQFNVKFDRSKDAIYHNLAVRLYFEGHFEGALENLELVRNANKQTETQILKYLIAEKIGNEEMMQEAFNRVLDLTNNVLLVDDREFFQDDLFIY
ncbi:MAG: hypothetical protein KBA81_07680 [Rhabdochlamydiaceae bacterium]|nr:hypothetical protein [Rhabdochlamydiaceae bacterium]